MFWLTIKNLVVLEIILYIRDYSWQVFWQYLNMFGDKVKLWNSIKDYILFFIYIFQGESAIYVHCLQQSRTSGKYIFKNFCIGGYL